ncbi:cytochrome P450 [Sphaerulina musiva SO2202]|uniref:Cytochrome P450 n=1 Tax=Sphaerulina musiva (strain SO2202) TaxID=692275 RepID=M3D8A7_SPHMS|nr:cytochrome P450 [Sphaerulina musiva SO2202]EMF14109.1 cytochrome P450 [Sphaerulina musiva SO2202]
MSFISLPTPTQTLISLALLYTIYHIISAVDLWNRRRAFKRDRGVRDAPRLPQKDPILGLDLFLENIASLKNHTLLETTASRFRDTGLNTFRLVALGRHMHATLEPENLKTCHHAHSREMLRPNFVRSQVGDVQTFEKHVSRLIATIVPGQEVDLSERFFRLTIDSATEFLFGESTDSLIKDGNDGFSEAFTQSQDFIGNLARWGNWAKLFPANKRFQKDRDFVHNFVNSYVQKGLARRDQLLAAEKNSSPDHQQQQPPERYLFIDALVRQTTDPIRIRSELLNILLAGRDTTASLLSNLWFTLARRPDIWRKLQSEITTATILPPPPHQKSSSSPSSNSSSQPPTFDQLKSMKYLRACLNESLRLYPVVPLNSREALEDTILPRGGGEDGMAPIFIPKGGLVSWNLWALHRRKDYFGEDAEKKGLRPGWEYLPFNGGARICLGQQFALTEASYVTVRICQEFPEEEKEEKQEEEPWREFLTLTCTSLNGAKVVLNRYRNL